MPQTTTNAARLAPIRLPEGLFAAFQRATDQRGDSMSAVVRQAIRAYVENAGVRVLEPRTSTALGDAPGL